MPVISFCHFSKRRVERDIDFFKRQGLSDEQIEAIKPYFYKRLCVTSYSVFFFAVVGLTAGFMIG